MVVGQNNVNQQEESVYNLIPRTEVRTSKPFRYRLINLIFLMTSFSLLVMHQNLNKMFVNHLKMANMNIEQWVMLMNPFLILNIFLRNNKIFPNKLFPMIVSFFFLLPKYKYSRL